MRSAISPGDTKAPILNGVAIAPPKEVGGHSQTGVLAGGGSVQRRCAYKCEFRSSRDRTSGYARGDFTRLIRVLEPIGLHDSRAHREHGDELAAKNVAVGRDRATHAQVRDLCTHRPPLLLHIDS